MPNYRIVEKSLQEKFFAQRTKIQVYGGGFANGKTSAACIRALELARDYPGSNGLIARSTYPKLNDTIRKEFLKWCPKHWIKSFPKSANGSNTCTLTNGSEINFRYIAQQGGVGGEATTSNLLSANYDWVIVDQMEDPEITEKDFDDLMGRLRGMAVYTGADPTMPTTGPRWFIITCNPTRNWVYRKLVRPYQLYMQNGMITDDLLCIRDPKTDKPILDDNGKPTLIMSLVEGSTYDNAENLEADYIQGLESTYRGTMRDRFLLGQWGAYEGLIYPAFDEVTHCVPRDWIADRLGEMQRDHYSIQWLEGFDHGIAVQSCYLAAYNDAWGNVFIMDGFYEKELGTDEINARIRSIRDQWNMPTDRPVLADPSIFKRLNAGKRTIGRSTAEMIYDEGRGTKMVRGNNDILNGILKVGAFLDASRMHPHPFTGDYGAPHLYINDELEWIANEFSTYIWRINSKGDREDAPRDKNDHAMDTIKYMLSRTPAPSLQDVRRVPQRPSYLSWHERDAPRDSPLKHRHVS